ncbi:hypothetical protein [Lentzea sp. NPDC004782]|uniref:hypothetical protein n=1 Tax=Lentzea sp. NPDC004782 TaxID=3154458 RepID=UPI0033A287DB
MSAVGQVDPRIQALFDENLARTRRSNAEITAKVRADQERLAAEAKAREEKHQKDLAASLASAKEVGKHGDPQQRKPQWAQRDRSAGEMAFGPEDDDAGYSPAPVSAPQPPPPPPPVAPPPPPMRSRRPARVDDDDDDLSGQTWLS